MSNNYLTNAGTDQFFPDTEDDEDTSLDTQELIEYYITKAQEEERLAVVLRSIGSGTAHISEHRAESYRKLAESLSSTN